MKPTGWSEQFVLLHDEERKFDAKYRRWNFLIQPGDLHGQYEALILETEETVDRAAQHFAKKKKWPELTPREIAALWERLDFGIAMAELLGQSQAQIPGVRSASQRTEWLLVFAWKWG